MAPKETCMDPPGYCMDPTGPLHQPHGTKGRSQWDHRTEPIELMDKTMATPRESSGTNAWKQRKQWNQPGSPHGPEGTMEGSEGTKRESGAQHETHESLSCAGPSSTDGVYQNRSGRYHAGDGERRASVNLCQHAWGQQGHGLDPRDPRIASHRTNRTMERSQCVDPKAALNGAKGSIA